MKTAFSILLILSSIGLFVFLGTRYWSDSKDTKTVNSAKISPNKPLVSQGKTPSIDFQLPNQFSIHIFTQDLGPPRDLIFSPKGTLLVSVPTQSSVIAIPDKNSDGIADEKTIVIDGLINPHGLAFYNGKLLVVTTTQVIRYAWDENTLSAKREKVLFSLPSNNNHKYRTITFDNKGAMYVSVGSTCNVCFETEEESATIMISNSNGDNPRIFAKGLRNAPFMVINPLSGQLWATEMGRDYLGDTLPPDEIDIIAEGGNYGWPVCFGKKIHDTNFDKRIYAKNPCTDTITPIYEIPAHSAPLGLSFINSSQFPKEWQNDLLVAYHGSWNRSVPDGYKIVRLNVQGDTITGESDFMTGFLPSSATSGNDALGRPVDLIFDTKGNLYVSDDKAGNIYIIEKK